MQGIGFRFSWIILMTDIPVLDRSDRPWNTRNVPSPDEREESLGNSSGSESFYCGIGICRDSALLIMGVLLPQYLFLTLKELVLALAIRRGGLANWANCTMLEFSLGSSDR
jgi:hypothetical protein